MPILAQSIKQWSECPHEDFCQNLVETVQLSHHRPANTVSKLLPIVEILFDWLWNGAPSSLVPLLPDFRYSSYAQTSNNMFDAFFFGRIQTVLLFVTRC